MLQCHVVINVVILLVYFAEHKCRAVFIRQFTSYDWASFEQATVCILHRLVRSN